MKIEKINTFNSKLNNRIYQKHDSQLPLEHKRRWATKVLPLAAKCYRDIEQKIQQEPLEYDYKSELLNQLNFLGENRILLNNMIHVYSKKIRYELGQINNQIDKD